MQIKRKKKLNYTIESHSTQLSMHHLPLQVLTPLVLIVNLIYLYLLQTTAYKIQQLFRLAFPLLAVKLSCNNVFIAILSAIVLLVLYLYYKVFRAKRSTSLRDMVFAVGLHVFLVVVTVSARFLTGVACDACLTEELPVRPVLTAHRGCPSQYPANSVQAFNAASRLDAVITLESDVRISTDKELFLLHDPYLVSTTSLADTCPNQDMFLEASRWSYYSGDCSLQSLRLKEDSSQSIPVLGDMLKVARETGKNVIFDLQPPHDGHQFINEYVDLTLKALVKSEIDLEKVRSILMRFL